MRYDFITSEILQNYKFFGIQFDSNQHTIVHGDDSISIPPLGAQFGKRIGNKYDLHISSGIIPDIDVSSFDTQNFTLIFKYNLVRIDHSFTIGKFFGYTIDFYISRSSGDCIWEFWNDGCKEWRNIGSIKNKTNTNYEFAIEVKPAQFKIWMNGKLMSTLYDKSYILQPCIHHFGNWGNEFYLNDIFCINKSDFLPDQYTVNWREPWFDVINKQIYIHNEDVYSK